MGTRGRKPIEIEREVLEAARAEVEDNDNPPKSHGELFSRMATAISDNISPSTVKKLCLAAGIAFKTEKGRKGDGSFGGKRGVAKGTRRKSNRGFDLDKFLQKVPKDIAAKPWFKNAAELASGGNRKATVKVNCVLCCGGERMEVRKCTANDSCVWFNERPYQRSPELVQIG